MPAKISRLAPKWVWRSRRNQAAVDENAARRYVTLRAVALLEIVREDAEAGRPRKSQSALAAEATRRANERLKSEGCL